MKWLPGLPGMGRWVKRLQAGESFLKAKTVSESGVSDGVYSSPAATGYTFIAAESLEAAVEKVKITLI